MPAPARELTETAALFRRHLLEDPTRSPEWVDAILTPREVVAEYPCIARSEKSLANMRARNRGPRFLKAPGGATARVAYKRLHILLYLEKCVVPTHDDCDA
jgi:hypothetical protein